MTRRLGVLLALAWAAPAFAFDSYNIDVPANVMKGDQDVFFTVTPYTGAVPDPTPHNIVISLPAGVTENPAADPPLGVDWSGVVAWGLNTSAAAVPGNTSITVTETPAAVPITTTRFFNLQNTVRSFEIVPPPFFAGTAGVDFPITIRARDGLGGGGAVVTGFNDSVTLSASTGIVIVNGAGNLVDGADFVNGEAVVNVRLLGTDPVSRTNRLFVTATVNYLNLGLATGFTDVNIDPGSYAKVILVFPGEWLTPGQTLTEKGGAPTPVVANVAVAGVVAWLTDQWNNPILSPPGAVTLVSESLSYPGMPRPPNDTVPPLKVINLDNQAIMNGEFVFYVGNEVHQVRVYDQADPLNNDTVGVQVNSGVASLIEVAAIPSPQDPSTSFIVTARVVDGTPAANTVLTFFDPAVDIKLTNCSGVELPAGTLDGDALTPGLQTTVPFAAGVFTGPVFAFPRVNGVCVKFDDGAGHSGESPPFNIIYGGAPRLHVTMPDQDFTPGQYPGNDPAIPVTRTAGDLVNVKVFVVDAGWNVLNNIEGGWVQGNVTVSLEPDAGLPLGYVDMTGGAPLMPASGNVANVNGVRLRTAYPNGNGRLVARMSGLTGESDLLTINPNTYNQIVFEVPGETLAPGIQPGIEPDGKLNTGAPQAVDTNFNFRVALTDAYFNPITNPPPGGWPQITFNHISPPGNDHIYGFANPFAMPGGVPGQPGGLFYGQMSLGTIGTNRFTVGDNGAPAKTSPNADITVVPGAVSYFIVTPNPLSSIPDPIANQQAGTPFNLTFKAYDVNGNIATNFAGSVSLQLWENSVPLGYPGTISPSTITFVAHPITGGVVTTTVSVTYAGQATGLAADQLQVRAFVSAPVMREGFSAFFNVVELPVWSNIVTTLPGEIRRPGLGPTVLKANLPNPILAGTSFPLTVTAVDFYGNRVDQAAVADLSIPTPNVYSNLGLPAQVILANGVGQSFPQVFTAGSVVINAEATAMGFVSGSTATITRGSYAAATGRLLLLAPGETILPGAPSPPGKNTVTISSVQANTSMAYQLFATDAFYNVDTTYNANNIGMVSNDGAISLAGIPIVNGSGTVSNVFLKGNLPNPSIVRVTATDAANAAKTSFSDVPVDPGAAYEITVPTAAVVGSTFTMTVVLRDPVTLLPLPVDNSITIEAVTSTGAAALIPPGVTLIDLVNGEVTFDQHYDYVETIQLRVRDAFNRLSVSNPIDITPRGLKYRVSLPAISKTTDEIFPVTVGLYDTTFDVFPIRGSAYQHTFNVSVEAVGLPAVGSYPVTAATLTEGVSTFNFSYTKAEHIVVRATGTAGPTAVNSGVDDMDITPGAYVKVQALAPGEVPVPGVPSLTGKSTAPVTPQAARESFAMTVNAVDRYWNVVPVNTQLNPTIQLTASDGSLAGLPLQSFFNGQSLFAGLSLNSPPEVTLTARDTGNPSISNQSVVIPLTGRIYIASTTPSGIDYRTGAGNPILVDLRLYRFSGGATGVLVQGFSGEVTVEPLTWDLQPLSTGNVVVTQPAPVSPTRQNVFSMNPAGIINLQLIYRVAEDIVLRFRDSEGWTGLSAPISLLPTGVNFEVTVPTQTVVGPPTTFPMTITPRDVATGTIPKNLEVSSLTITAFNVAGGGPAGPLLVGDATLDSGAVTFPQGQTRSGTFRFQVNHDGNIFLSDPIVFLPGPLASLDTDLPAILEAGTTREVRVTLMDSFSNPIPNLVAQFALSDPSFAVLSTTRAVTDVNGEALTTMTLNAQRSGLVDFIATAGGFSVRESFRLLGPPTTTLSVNGHAISVGQGLALKPGDQIRLNASVEPGMALLSIHYRIDGGTLTVYPIDHSAPISFATPGIHTIEFFAIGQSALLHTEAVRVSRTVYVSAITTAEEGVVNYPNPFRAGRDTTILEYQLAGDSSVRLTIYDLMGGKVHERELVQGQEGGTNGLNRISWDGRNDSGEVVANGGYIAVLDLKNEGRMMRRKIAVRK